MDTRFSPFAASDVYRRVLDSMTEGVSLSDETGVIVYTNAAENLMFGYGPGELLGQHVTVQNAYPPDENERVVAEVISELRRGGVWKGEWRNRRKDGTEFVTSSHISAVELEGRPHWLCVQEDVTDRRRAEAELRETTARLNAVLSNATVSLFLMDDQHHCVYMNPAAERLTGYRFEETQGRPLHDVIHHTRPDGSHFPHQECAIGRALPERNVERGEEVFVHKDGSFYPVAYAASPILDETASMVGTIVEVRGISAEREAEERRRLLLNELNHRVKNTLAVVQGVAAQTLRSEADPVQARRALEGRLMALSAAHDILTRESWEGADLGKLVADTVGPFAPDRLDASGPPLRLNPKTAVSFALALHELASNALKYGALSNADGRVSARWTLRDQALDFRWEETGGPPVEAPKRAGFGSRLLERGLASELNGQVRVHYRPEGVVCTIEAPLSTADGGDG
ncbi:MAG TPA: PAS domain S-box protein [Caulobacteraceae bacterium]